MVLNPTRRTIARGALAALLGAKAALAFAKPIDQAADAELFRLCRQAFEAGRQFRQAEQRQEAVPRPMTMAGKLEWDRLDDIACEWSARVADLEDAIGELSTRTAPGLQLKQQVLALSLPVSRRPAGLEQAIELTLARNMPQVAP